MQFLAPSGRQRLALLALLLGGVAATFLISGYELLVISMVGIWAMLGLSWNILGGYGGLVSFGHAAFFGGGAYTVAILFHDYGVTPWIGCLLGAGIGALLAVLIGAITFRLKGHYFSLAMLAYPLALIPVFTWAGWHELALPLQRQDPLHYMQFSDPRVMPLIILGALGIALFICLRIERTRLGLQLFAIRQNELAAQCAGIATLRTKLVASAISGGIAGLAGALYATVVLVVTPHSVFGMLVSAQGLIVSMFGGLGAAWGPVIGAIILVPLAEMLNATIGARLPGMQGVVFGIAIMAVILFRPQGIYWAVRDHLVRAPAVAPELAAPPAPEAAVPHPDYHEAPGEALLVVRGVSVRFGGLQALSDVSLEVRRGEILGIIGPNGAGKTTLFNVLNGITRASAGSAQLEGVELLGRAPQQVSAMGIARTFQTVRAFPRLTLLENVVVGAFGANSDDRAALEVARAMLERVGLADRALVPASQLTNRELRLMELARALASNPKLVLMDESFAGLSSADVEVMMRQIRRLAAEGMTVVIIEHTMKAMVRLATRFVVLDRGRNLAEGLPEQVVREPEVVSAYLGKKWVEHAGA
ncbi:branched-chain amino acid ABC transporter ATP-binding protein/permease [Pseudoroseomonas cervicalis]|uniref:branched-chain amino acid ABC transporter ATP-binding protein/permease n=1 Tax=Teichococcus cervicalis TaxID=204525 RepID=UPI0022F1A245|nr:branched-chain amino acid ABC transporter ATP-binding protein/permease [Pseudoroseomonas cervicalis]WBV45219.1 branched-chain amino acid ABC transporter ATP-binding protein/permease [Pseudoroseomonas cervicalis]